MPTTNNFYATYDHRLLPAYDEDAEIQTTKHEIKTLKKDTVSSTQNAIRIAAQAEATGTDILERLGVQQERLLNAEENVEEADIEMAIAGEKVRKIKRLRRSLWGIFRNPFAMIRRQRRIKKIEERRLRLVEAKRERREGKSVPQIEHQDHSAEAMQDSRNLEPMDETNDELATPPVSRPRNERMRYQFEADSEDEEVEDEIEENLGHLYTATIRLKKVGEAIGQELDSQKMLVNRIVVKVDRNEDQVALNAHRQDRLRKK
jgi:hypothetical protein